MAFSGIGTFSVGRFCIDIKWTGKLKSSLSESLTVPMGVEEQLFLSGKTAAIFRSERNFRVGKNYYLRLCVLPCVACCTFDSVKYHQISLREYPRTANAQKRV